MSFDKEPVSIQNFDGLIDLGSSKRLLAMRNKVQVEAPQPIRRAKVLKELTQLEHARELIEQKIKAIKASYPDGKRHKLFALRYASEKRLKMMSIGELFILLQLDSAAFKPVLAFAYCE